MRLKNVARYFDTCKIYDGYTDAYLFKAQSSTFMESASEGAVSVRRMLSLDPNLAIPTRAVIKVLGTLYVVGEENLDEWASEAVRKTCWTRKVSDYFSVKSPNELLTEAVGFSAYAQKGQKTQKPSYESASVFNTWEMSFSVSEAVEKNKVLTASSGTYLVNAVYKDTDGFLTAEATELDGGAISISVDAGKVYDPVSDTYTGSSISVQALLVDYRVVFDLQTQADYAAQAGDKSLILPASLSPASGLTLSFPGGELQGTWTVLNVSKFSDAFNAHIRRL